MNDEQFMDQICNRAIAQPGRQINTELKPVLQRLEAIEARLDAYERLAAAQKVQRSFAEARER
jgi:hypothetical protein